MYIIVLGRQFGVNHVISYKGATAWLDKKKAVEIAEKLAEMNYMKYRVVKLTDVYETNNG